MAAILTATDLVVHFNDRPILDQASLSIDAAARIGLVGRNGSGKSTFLKILAEEIAPDGGHVARRKEAVVGYLPQDFSLDPGLSVEENVAAGAGRIQGLIREFEALEGNAPRHAEIERQIVALDGWTLDQRIATVMSHLNCPDGSLRIDTLSGGEARRVALSRALVSQPDLLLLDEPTNHLDTESIEWLGEFLQSYRGAFVLVTHDRYFLDSITSTIVELDGGKFYSYSGNYTDYLIGKAERQATEETLEHKRQMFLRRELEWVRRSPQARSTKSKSRLDRYFETAGKSAPVADRTLDLIIPPPPQLGNRIVELTEVGMELGGRTLFSELDLNLAADQRVGITGRNGLGKTTLIKIILGQLPPTSGTVRIGQLTRFNYIDQERLQLNDDNTVLDEVSDGTEFVVFGDQRLSLRAYLKRFLFTEDRIATRVRHLSGGERSRLLLARILKNGGNVLVLDEPTNDLDLPTLRVLEEALTAFPGTVLVVSHDRYFLNRVCTTILAFEGNGSVRRCDGRYDDYLEQRRRREAIAAGQSAGSQGSSRPKTTSTKTAKPGRPRKLSFKERRELDGMEERILEAESEVARLESIFSDPDFHRVHGQQTQELAADLDAAKGAVVELYERWESLEKLRAGAAEPTVQPPR